jgi:hypothetical protein
MVGCPEPNTTRPQRCCRRLGPSDGIKTRK